MTQLEARNELAELKAKLSELEASKPILMNGPTRIAFWAKHFQLDDAIKAASRRQR